MSKRIQLSIKEYLAVTVIKNPVMFNSFKKIAEWLDCYEYIVPADRYVNSELLSLCLNRILKFVGYSSTSVYKLWLVSDILFTCYNAEEQKRILEWIQS